MKLYGFPGGPFSRHFRCEWLLNELDVKFEFIALDFLKREHRSEQMRGLNPNGRVPVLEDEDLVIWESAAICNYLGDKYPGKKMVPRPGTAARAHYDQWMFFAIGELDAQMMIIGKAMAPHYFPEIVPDVRVDENTRKVATEAAKAEFQNFAKIVEEHLKGREHLVDSGFSAVDIVMWTILNGAQLQGLLTDFPTLKAYVTRLQTREAFPEFQMPNM